MTIAKIIGFVKVKIVQILQWMLMWASPAPPRLKPLGYCDAHVGVACVLCTPSAHIKVAGRVLQIKRFKPPRLLSFSPLSSLSFSTSYSYPWCKSSSGDILGTESGIHIIQDLSPSSEEEVKHPKQSRVYVAKKQDIPPPISILTNYIGLLPTILENEDLADGEYFETIRRNGCLVINRVTVYNSIGSGPIRNEEFDELAVDDDLENVPGNADENGDELWL